MSSFTPESKSAAPTFTNESKNVTTFTPLLRRGKEAQIISIEDRVLNDPNFIDESTLEDQTFDQLDDETWQNQSKN